MSALPDGDYDAFVVDAHRNDDGATVLELTILAGEYKGEVVTVTATGLVQDELELLGTPATLTVAGGRPQVSIDN